MNGFILKRARPSNRANSDTLHLSKISEAGLMSVKPF